MLRFFCSKSRVAHSDGAAATTSSNGDAPSPLTVKVVTEAPSTAASEDSSDVAARAQAAAPLLEILNSLRDAIVVRGKDGAITFQNDAHRSMSSSGSSAKEKSPSGYSSTLHCVLPSGGVLEVLTPRPTVPEGVIQMKNVVEALPSPIVFTMKGRGAAMTQVFSVRSDFKKLPGVKAMESGGRSFLKQAAHPDDLMESSQLWARVMAVGGTYEREIRVRWPDADGPYRWFFTRAVPVSFDADGGSSDYVGSVTDIDDQKRAQAAQADERSLFRAVLEQLPIAVYVAQADGHIVYANDLAGAITDGMSKARPRSPGGGADGSSAGGALLSGGVARRSAAVSPELKQGASSYRLTVTASLMASASARRSELSVANTSATAPEGLWGWAAGSSASSEAGNGMGVRRSSSGSHSLERYHTTTQTQVPLAPTAPTPLLSPLKVAPAEGNSSTPGPIADIVARVLRGDGDGVVSEEREWVMRTDGLGPALSSSRRREHGAAAGGLRSWSGTALSLRLTGTRVHDHDGNTVAVVVVAEDVSAQRRLEAERARLQALEHGSLAVRAAFGNMSHELRTPLNAVLGFAELLIMSTEGAADDAGSSAAGRLSGEQMEYARGIHDSGTLVLRLINDILDYMRAESGKMELERAPFDIRRCTQLVQSMMTSDAHKRGVALRVSVTPQVPERLLGDTTRLSQVLLNLLSNALKFTPAGGSVDCGVALASADSSASGADLKAPTMELAPSASTWAAPAPLPVCRLRVEVRDTGIGMPPQVLSRLFKPFSQADSSTTRTFGGTGLGLSICKQLVELMGGTIGVRSAPGKGSTFWFEVALSRGASSSIVSPVPSPVPAAATDIARSKAPSLRILLAEDNRVNTLLCVRMLQRLGYTDVTTAADGEEAVNAAAGASSPFALCLMDIQMPNCDGLEATRRIRALADRDRASLPIVALSASVLPPDVAECLAAGMQAHVAKPLQLSALEAAVEAWARRRP